MMNKQKWVIDCDLDYVGVDRLLDEICNYIAEQQSVGYDLHIEVKAWNDPPEEDCND